MQDKITAAFVELKDTLQNEVKDSFGKYSADVEARISKMQDVLDAAEFSAKNVNPVAKASTENSELFAKAMLDLHTKNSVQAFGDKSYTLPNGKSTTMVRFDQAAGGALLAPPEFSRDLNKQIVEITPSLSLVNLRTISGTSGYRQLRRDSSLTAYAVAEAASVTQSRDSFGYTEIPFFKEGARVDFTLEMMQDAYINIEQEIASSVAEQFARKDGADTINGSGVGRPTGMVGNVSSINSGATSLASNMLVSMVYAIKSYYLRNASWMANRQTWREVRKLVLSTTNGLQYTWEPNFQTGQPSRLLGFPVYEAPDLVAPGSGDADALGTYSAADVPILFGDFRYGYTFIQHPELYVIRDPYTLADSGEVRYIVHRRTGGDVVRSEAIVQLSITS